MLISGCTVIRNARIMGYPVVPAIKSLLPIVDEYVVAVGQSDDDTRAMVESIGDPRIRIVDTIWDKTKQKGGYILADKTNEALAHCRGEWCFYLQADEVVHEQDHAAIRHSCETNLADSRVEGLLCRYVHFYGSYSVVATARNWYRQEVRIVRRSANPRSVGDAQSFMIGDRKARVKWSGGTIYHYGHVKPPEQMGQKHEQMSRWYRGNARDGAFKNFRYKQIYGLKPFRGTHPAVMRDLVASQDWEFEARFDPSAWDRKTPRLIASDILEAITGHRFGERKKFELLK
jgi:glycosyltransferase involved in cell wall biosynthesis